MATDERPRDLHDRIRAFWDEDAETYDRAPGHAVSHPAEAAAWRAALARNLPPPGARVLDVGSGTGAMGLLAAELGYRVTGLDLSPGMLAEAARKAEARGVEFETVVGPADEPPPGPFDAVIERHVLWTLPDPVRALARWREVAPEGRLILFEGEWGGTGPVDRAKQAARGALSKVLSQPPDHHGSYDPDVLSSLPLSSAMTADAAIRVAAEGGWRALRLERLRDVEWARRRGAHPLLGPLEHAPRFAVIGFA